MSVDEVGGLQVELRLGYMLKRAAGALEALNDAAVSPLGIDAREMGILIAVAGEEPGSQQEVAERIGIDRTSMVLRLDVLEEKGLVSRHPDAEDRRRNVVELTASGRAVVRRAITASDRAEAQLLAGLSGPEAEQLRELLAVITRQPRPCPD